MFDIAGCELSEEGCDSLWESIWCGSSWYNHCLCKKIKPLILLVILKGNVRWHVENWSIFRKITLICVYAVHISSLPSCQAPHAPPKPFKVGFKNISIFQAFWKFVKVLDYAKEPAGRKYLLKFLNILTYGPNYLALTKSSNFLYLLFTQQVHLALYCHNAGLASVALKLMYRARYLALVVYGEGHPDMATFDVTDFISNIVQLLRELHTYSTFFLLLIEEHLT